jgi:GDP-4-dehydro-6-deoxy-D-mannose reductase
MAVEQFAEQIRQATRGGPRTVATGDLSVVRDFIDVEDVCARLWALCRAQVTSGEIVNVASGRGVAMREVVERLVALAGGGIEIRTDPSRLRANDLRAHVSSTAKLERLVHPPALTPLDDTLRRVLAWQPDTIARR